MAEAPGTLAVQDCAGTGGDDGAITVALVNAMSDAALAITEQRFFRLLQSAFPARPVILRCVTLPEIPRGEMASARIARFYATLPELMSAAPDAVVFSGAEPAACDLRAERFWPSLTALFDWVRREEIPSLFSCLSAHAAVLHFSGVTRIRLPRKQFGMFAQSPVLPHTLLGGVPRRFEVAHSRWHEVAAADLIAAGYDILTAGPDTEVDMFAARSAAPMLFLQGHPEYEDAALEREYRRDMRRYQDGESKLPPERPRGPAAAPPADRGGFAEEPAPAMHAQGGSFAGTLVRNWILAGRKMTG